MKKIILVMAMLVMAFVSYAATGEGVTSITPASGNVGAWVSAATITAKNFKTAFSAGNKIIITFPSGMPTPNITPVSGNVTLTTKNCVPSAYALAGQNITITLAAGAPEFAEVKISYYGGVTIPAAGAYTWAFKTSSNSTAPASIPAANNKAIFTSIALTFTPTVTPTITATPTATVPANKPVTVTGGLLIHKGPATLKGLTILSRVLPGELILANASNGADALTAANIYLTISPAAGVNPTTYEFCEEAEEGIYFDKGIYGYTKVTVSSNLNNTINAYFRY